MKKILIVDEERWYMEAILDYIDTQIGEGLYDHCLDGASALRKMKETPYKIVVLDMMLPLGDGLKLPENEPDLTYGIFILRKMREFNKVVPIICYTILDEHKIRKQVEALGATYLCKLNSRSFDQLISEIKKQINYQA